MLSGEKELLVHFQLHSRAALSAIQAQSHHIGDGEHHQRDSDVGQHIRQIIQQGIEPGAAHRQAEERLGHIFRPNGSAYHVVYQETGKTGDERTGEHAAPAPCRQAGQTKHRKGQQIVADDRLPTRGVRDIQEQLQQSEGKRDQQARSEAPADAEDKNREHGQRHRAAVRQLPELDVAQHLCQSHKDCTLAERAQRDLGLVFHFSTSIIFSTYSILFVKLFPFPIYIFLFCDFIYIIKLFSFLIFILTVERSKSFIF